MNAEKGRKGEAPYSKRIGVLFVSADQDAPDQPAKIDGARLSHKYTRAADKQNSRMPRWQARTSGRPIASPEEPVCTRSPR
jgi:hypothetical protein